MATKKQTTKSKAPKMPRRFGQAISFLRKHPEYLRVLRAIWWRTYDTSDAALIHNHILDPRAPLEAKLLGRIAVWLHKAGMIRVMDINNTGESEDSLEPSRFWKMADPGLDALDELGKSNRE